MKKNSIICSILALLFGCADSSSTETPGYSTLGILIDRTDKQLLRCDPVPVLTLLNCTAQPDSGAWVHLSSITDKKYNEDYTVHLPATQEMSSANMDDPQARRKIIVGFYGHVKTEFADFYRGVDSDRVKNRSEVFTAVARELQWLKERKAARNFLIICSDVMEHSSIENSYLSANQDNIRQLTARFNSLHLLPDTLPGFTVFILHVPKDSKESERYSAQVAVYTSLLESRGAKVIIQTNAQNYLP
jgi:hypothetical protein